MYFDALRGPAIACACHLCSKQNILVTPALDAKICDFGTSVVVKGGGEVAVLAGLSPLYAAPEVIDKKSGIVPKLPGNRVGKKSDVFAAGLVLRFLFTGETPADTWVRPPKTLYERKVPDLPESVPKPLADLMKRMWSHCGIDRPTSAEVVAEMSQMWRLKPEDLWSPTAWTLPASCVLPPALAATRAAEMASRAQRTSAPLAGASSASGLGLAAATKEIVPSFAARAEFMVKPDKKKKKKGDGTDGAD